MLGDRVSVQRGGAGWETLERRRRCWLPHAAAGFDLQDMYDPHKLVNVRAQPVALGAQAGEREAQRVGHALLHTVQSHPGFQPPPPTPDQAPAPAAESVVPDFPPPNLRVPSRQEVEGPGTLRLDLGMARGWSRGGDGDRERDCREGAETAEAACRGGAGGAVPGGFPLVAGSWLLRHWSSTSGVGANAACDSGGSGAPVLVSSAGTDACPHAAVSAAGAGASASASASRSMRVARARATRERTVPTGQSLTSAASAYGSPSSWVRAMPSSNPSRPCGWACSTASCQSGRSDRRGRVAVWRRRSMTERRRWTAARSGPTTVPRSGAGCPVRAGRCAGRGRRRPGDRRRGG